MAITRYAGDRFTIADGETKPTGVLDGAYLIDTGNLTQFVRRTVGGSSQWTSIAGGGGGGSPGGSNTQVQFNDNGAFGGSTGLTFDGQRLYANNFQLSGILYDSNASVGEGGMVLANEGQTGVHWKSIESVLSGVGGSGVANYVARWSDEDTLTSGTIYDDGDVGIGTNSPNAKLHVYDTVVSDMVILESIGPSAVDGPDVVFYRNSASPADSDDLGILKFRGRNDNSQDVNYAQIEGEAISVADGAEGGALNFHTHKNGTSAVRMVITGDNVGIGLTTPQAPLEIVCGSIATAAECLSLTQNSAGTYGWKFGINNSVNGNLLISNQLNSVDSLRFTITPDGKVGIGTASPGCELHVSGEDPRIRVDGITDSHPGFELSENGTRKWITYNNYVNDNLTFKTNADIRMVIQQDGNVGIGTGGPDQLLHVYRATDDATLHLEAISAGDPTITFTSPNNRNGVLRFLDGSTVARFNYDHANVAFEFKAHNESTIDASISENVQYFAGDVGIGTNAPDTKLTVDTNKNFDTTVELARFYVEKANTSANRAAGIKFGGRRDGLVVNRYATIDAFRGTAVAANLIINKDGGYVGIGNNTNPAHHLHVDGDAIISGVLYDSTNSSGVSGHVLTSEVGGPQWKMIEDVLSGVGGNGTATYIPQWIDSDTIGDSVISQSGSNIGINMTAANPATELHIGSLAAPAQGGNWASLSIGEDNYPERRTQINAYRSLRGGDWDHMGISFQPHTSSSHLDGPTITGMAIDYDGYVGIGTNAPNELLEIFNSTADGNATIRLSAEGDTSGERALEFFEGAYNRFRIATVGANGNLEIHRSTTGNSWEAVPAISINKADGNVGIGTTTPADLLNLYSAGGGIRIEATAGSPNAIAQLAYSNTNGFFFRLPNAANAENVMIRSYGTSHFNGGSVGIGTASPGTDLDVVPAAGSGNIRVKGQSTSDASLVFNEVGVGDVGKIGWDGSEGLLKIGKDFTKNGLVVNTTSNKVGIGVGLDPQHNLHVSGDAIISGVLYDSTNSSGVSGHVLTSEVGGPQWKMIEDVLSGVGGNGTAEYIPRWTDSDTIGDSVMAQSGSAIGIGTDAPIVSLSVESKGASDGIALYDSNGDRRFIAFTSGGTDGMAKLKMYDENDVETIRLNTNGNDTFFNGGNVGIGTTNPGKTLDVDGDIRIRGDSGTLSFYRDTSPSDIAYIKYLNGTSRLDIAANNKAIVFMNENGPAESMRITSAGSVGIGTNAPAMDLHVVGTAETNVHYEQYSNFALEDAEARMQIIADDGGTGGALLCFSLAPATGNNKHWIIHHAGPTASNNLEFGYMTSAATDFDANGMVPDMVITTAGDVGIGTDAPGSKLTVNQSGGAGEVSALSLIHSRTGTPANGDAVSIEMRGDFWTGSAANERVMASIRATVEDVTNGAPKGKLALATLDTTGAITDKVTILSDGNVGIGTSSPDAKLHILGKWGSN